ncbi:MAG TPA: glycosyltransferase, partial [Candidatus Limnocylindria bacterium]|nr:glycosyltransferase [Candidatus Limnocylindria bacterium]
ACGKPVVACTLRSGVPWVCVNEVTGLTVPPGEYRPLMLALRRLLGDESLRQRLGAEGRRRANSEFAVQVMVRRYQSLFRQLVNEQRSA